ncbi:hypothetical protein ACYSNO_10850 [Enterococcus sp. LJL98]
MKTNNIAKINGLEVTTKHLEKNAIDLTKLSTRLDLVVKLLSNVNYQRLQGDEFSMTYFFDGQLTNVIDFLQDCQEEILEVSNEICPD